MEKKELAARLKENPTVYIALEADFESDWLVASKIVELAKRSMISELKQALHEKIASLSLEDIEFKVR